MDEIKRILILMADAGSGHRSAAEAIAAALQELHGAQCLVEIVNPLDDTRAPAFLRDSQTAYDGIVQRMPELYKLGYDLSDAPLPTAVMESALTVALFDIMRDLVRSRQPDAIVTVYPDYLAPLGAVFTLAGQHVPLITVVTDLVTVHRLWFNDSSDLCLVATQDAYELAVGSGLAADKVRITGIPVNPKLADDARAPAAIRAALGWRTDLTTILAVGGTRVLHLVETLHTLDQAGLPLQMAVVSGGDDEVYRQLCDTEWHIPTHVYDFAEDMPSLLRAADGIICKAGGLIVSEALACGLPILLVSVIEGQETGNAEYIIAGGASERAGSPAEALEIMQRWLDNSGELLVERARHARGLGRPRAAYEVAELAWAAAGRGPYASPDNEKLPRLTSLLNLLNLPRGD